MKMSAILVIGLVVYTIGMIAGTVITVEVDKFLTILKVGTAIFFFAGTVLIFLALRELRNIRKGN